MSKGSILITGVNGGLGTAFTTKLLSSPHATQYHTIYAVRNPSKAFSLNTILSTAPSSHSHELLPLDLTSLTSIRATATSLNARIAAGEIPPIRALILNAAIQKPDPVTLTQDGYEEIFAVNYLANFLLVLLLLPSMESHGRIIAISSALHDSEHWMNNSHFPAGKKEMFTSMDQLVRGEDDLDGTEEELAMRRYGRSKCLLIMFMLALQRHLNSSPAYSNISTMSLNPGGMGGAELSKRGPWPKRFMWTYIFPVVQEIAVWWWPNGALRTNSKSAADLLALVVREDVGKGEYWDGGVRGESSGESKDLGKHDLLWKESLRLVGLSEAEIGLRT
jgi:NAD(P)-dependent dehydrogenase (short-subunit alcohol dehydrogenase family)